MMPRDPSSPLARRLIRGDLQGYLSLALTAMLLEIPYLSFAFTPFGTALGLAAFVLVLAFGIRGVAYRRGGGRVAALVSLSVLFAAMIASVLIACLNTVNEMDTKR